MLPIVSIVGRPNVGKSSLFNRLIRRRTAIVDDVPGVTRDRLYAPVEWDGKNLVLVDTGGFDSSQDGAILDGVTRQVEIAIEEADLIILMFDGKAGPAVDDEELLTLLRRSGKKVVCAVNKIDGLEQEHLSLEFYSLGMDRVFPISAAHGYGIATLMEQVIGELPGIGEIHEEEDRIRIAIIGRPNVGKSSLINRVIGSERLVVSELPGTTRDSVDISFERDGRPYVLIDTAGIRRRARVKERVEWFSISRALKAINRCDIAIILLECQAGVYEQDARICGYALEVGCGMVIALNKWDLIRDNPPLVRSLEDSIDRQLRFIPFVPRIRVSALTGENVRKLFDIIDKVWAQYNLRVTTPTVNRALGDAVKKYPPPSTRGRRAKFFYATQISVRPPAFVIFVNRLDSIPAPYQRYLVNQLRERLGLGLIPVKILLRER